MSTDATIEALRVAARALTSAGPRERARAIQVAQDALDAAKAEAFAEIETTREFELDGASTLATWARNELRLSAKEANALTRASSTFSELPDVGTAAGSGLIRSGHVAVFTYGLKHLGDDVMTRSMSWLLDVARTCEPTELFRVVRALREAVQPDELERAWVEGMDRQDFTVSPVAGGWHVSGFLNVIAGAKLKAVLDSVSAPRDKDDLRPGSERRVQGLDDLLTRVLESGLPADKGVRPHLSVIVDTDTLAQALAHRPGTPAAPAAGTTAHLVGFGPIGPSLTGQLACLGDLTPILTDVNADSSVLDVGRTRRLATLKQRRAVFTRQHGQCAAPGCTHTHLEVHHVSWWSNGGPTDLANLVGLCVRCHHLVHRGLLVLTPDVAGRLEFRTRHHRLVARRRRVTTPPNLKKLAHELVAAERSSVRRS